MAENLDWLMQSYFIEHSSEGMKPELMGKLVDTFIHAIGKMFENLLLYTSWKISLKIDEHPPYSTGVLVRVFITDKEGQDRELTQFNLPEDHVEQIVRRIIENMSLVHIQPRDIVLDW